MSSLTVESPHWIKPSSIVCMLFFYQHILSVVFYKGEGEGQTLYKRNKFTRISKALTNVCSQSWLFTDALALSLSWQSLYLPSRIYSARVNAPRWFHVCHCVGGKRNYTLYVTTTEQNQELLVEILLLNCSVFLTADLKCTHTHKHSLSHTQRLPHTQTPR